MTNLEFYKNEIIKGTTEIEMICAIAKIKDKKDGKDKNIFSCSGTDCDGCIEKSINWLLEEHKEQIKLKQWEYDLIIKVTESINQIGSFESYTILYKMKRMGYFQGVTNIKMTVEEILTNCEVVE